MTDPIEPIAPKPFQPVPPEPSTPLTQPPAVPVRRSNASQGRLINVALGLALAIAVAGVAFAAGRMTSPAVAAAGLGGDGRASGNEGYFPAGGHGVGQGGRAGFGAGGATIQGTVTAVTANSITITTTSGQNVTLAINGTTTYYQRSNASASDVKTGGTVVVRVGLQPDATGTATGPTANDITVVP